MGGTNPYSTGGGGTVLEHRYGALLLSHLLTADPLFELGDDVTPHEITFQASAFSAVDDIVVSGYLEDGTERRVSIGVRRTPSFVLSDESSVDLISSYLRVLNNHPFEVTSGKWRLALAVASPNTHVKQVRELAGIARDVIDNRQFRAEVARPGRTAQEVRDRLIHFDKVVAAAAIAVDIDIKRASASDLTWSLLSTLRLRELRLEGVDESDRTIAVARLRQITKSETVDAADRLFSRLAELVGRYAPAAATKNNSTLRRDLNGLVKSFSTESIRAAELAGRASAGIISSGTMGQASPAVRSDYLSQVQRIAPGKLLDREQETSYLTEFCVASDSKTYLWLKAAAWAGKSALLSSFVLNPPKGVRIVSFFITARLAGQGDRIAFTDVILEQVLELIGEPMPTLLSDATRDAHLLGSLARAARICQDKGERLILIVDGLDEDLGVTTGLDSHSIAAILPANPPAGMRVVVAGRPNPPIPADVPDDHPLRDLEIVRPLMASPHAEVVRQDAERELKRLLRGTTVEQDLLGLITAAGGGLSGADLAELTGSSNWEIEDHLRVVSGRTFTPRAGRWRPKTIVYLLGHEELQQQAIKFIGEGRLESYRSRLHVWAAEYHNRNWPNETPEYLLRGYFRLLHATNDLQRMLMFAIDTNRHDRMLDIIGGDTSALTEITMTQEAIADQAVPDLLAMSRLAIHRTKIIDRNENIPVNLPGVWVQLDRPSRAEALARSISHPSRRVRALAAVVREIAASGDFKRAKILGIHAEQAISSIADPYQRANAFAVVARAVAEAKDSQRADILINQAEALTRTLASPSQQTFVLIAIARAVAIVGNVKRAKSIAYSISTWSERDQAIAAVATEVANSGNLPVGQNIAATISSRSERAQALSAVARAASAAGDWRKAVEITEQAEVIASVIRNPGRKAWALIAIAHAMATIDNQDKAEKILNSAEQLSGSITKPSDREDTLINIARARAIVGDPSRSVIIARSIANISRRARALAAVSSGLVISGHQGQAEAIACEAEALARSITSSSHESKGLSTLSQAAVTAGDLERAETIAYSISDLAQRWHTLTIIAEAIAARGDLERAKKVAVSITDSEKQEKALEVVVRAGVASGDFENAERMTQKIHDPTQRTKLLALISSARDSYQSLTTDDSITQSSSQPGTLDKYVKSQLNSGDLDRAESIAHSIEKPYPQSNSLILVAQAAVGAGDIDRAERVVGTIANVQLRTRAFVVIARAIANAGDTKRAQSLINQALVIASSTVNPSFRDKVIKELLPELAKIDNGDRAIKIARSFSDPVLRGQALAAIALAVASLGKIGQAERIVFSIADSSKHEKWLAAIVRAGIKTSDLGEAEAIAFSISDPLEQSRALRIVAEAYADAGHTVRAASISRSIIDLAEKTRALANLADKVITDEARHLLAHALTVGHWQICLTSLIRVEPEVVEVMADEFLRTIDQR
ncbi:hypothetical protein [Streptosporangium sp. NPDC006930]|uniref:hypothetical protein n=1 Tax=Streptosporangium sp. NPDC006930 TaxID=3154783 RepID=UPI00342057D2